MSGSLPVRARKFLRSIPTSHAGRIAQTAVIEFQRNLTKRRFVAGSVVPDAGNWHDLVHFAIGPYEMAKDFDAFSCVDCGIPRTERTRKGFGEFVPDRNTSTSWSCRRASFKPRRKSFTSRPSAAFSTTRRCSAKFSVLCHCHMCRQWTGSAMLATAAFDRDAVAFTAREPRVHRSSHASP